MRAPGTSRSIAGMRSTSLTVTLATCAVLLAGCSSSSGGSASSTGAGTSAAATTSAGSTTSSSSPSSSISDTGVATSLDPCRLVTQSEASALAGTSFGKGKEQTSGNGKQCVYGAQTKNVFTVELGQSQSASTARAEWSQAQAEAKSLVSGKLPPGVHVTLQTGNASGIGDRAATIYGSTTIGGLAVGFSGIYALKGATFFAFQDLVLGHSPPSLGAMTAEAKKAAGRV
jgi:hypothetical protein